MHPAIVIAVKDLRQRLRDRSAIVLGFVAPIAIAALMSFAFQGAESFHAKVGYASADRGPLAAAFSELLHQPDLRSLLTVRRYPDEAAARAAVDDRKVSAAVVVPAGFSEAIAGGAATQVRVLATTDSSLEAQVLRSVADGFVAQVNADRLSVAAALAAGAAPDRLARLVADASTLRLPATVVQRSVTDRQLKTISYYAPGMGIFFVLFAIGFGARGWFLEKAGGTLDRVAAAPIGLGTVLLGKALATFAYAVASLGTMAVVSSLAFGADWGNPLAVAILCVAMALPVVALTVLVIAVARTDRQVDGLASIVTFALALAGGNFVLLSAAPALLRRLALFTPNGWALRGFTDLATGSRGLGTVVEPVLGILAFTAVVAVLGVAGTRRLVRR